MIVTPMEFSVSRAQEMIPSDLPNQPISCLVGHSGSIHALRFSHDGRYCLTAGQDRTVRLWNPTRLDPAYTPESSNTKTKLLSGRKEIPHALPIQTFSDGHTHSVSAIDIDDTTTTLLSSSEKALVVSDIVTNTVKRRLTTHSGRINAVKCTSGAEVFLSASYDGTVRIWDGRSKNSNPIQVLSDAKDSVSCLEVIQDSANNVGEIITGSIDGCVRTYDLRRGELSCDSFGRDVSVTSIAITKNRMCLVASCLDGVIHVLERKTGSLLRSISGCHKGGKYALSCSITADDVYVASGSETGDAALYDLYSGQEMQILRGHIRPTCSVACSPLRENKQLVITASYDGNAVVWSNDSDSLQIN